MFLTYVHNLGFQIGDIWIYLYEHLDFFDFHSMHYIIVLEMVHASSNLHKWVHSCIHAYFFDIFTHCVPCGCFLVIWWNHSSLMAPKRKMTRGQTH